MSRYRVIVTEDAANDFREAFDYLVPRSPRAAQGLTQRVAAALKASPTQDAIHASGRSGSPERILLLTDHS